MNEQLQYTITSRHRFLKELHLPKRLVNFSLNSMQTAKGGVLQPNNNKLQNSIMESLNHDESPPINKAFSTFLTPLKPIQDETPIIGIDTSSVKIGETETGVISAVRGAVVLNHKRRYRCLRLGPFPFHITEDNKHDIFKERFNSHFNNGYKVFTLAESQIRLCNIIERRIQTCVSRSIIGNIILFDGSLIAGTPGNPSNELSYVLKVARRNENCVLAFSKTTSVRFLGRRITDLAVKYKSPCLFELEDLPLSIMKTMHLLGRINVTRLSSSGYPFRLDIDRVLTRKQSIAAVERLIGNDLFYQGYPETLRLAHIYSTFTANEVLGIQSFLTKKYRLHIISHRNIRKTLFGPYGTLHED